MKAKKRRKKQVGNKGNNTKKKKKKCGAIPGSPACHKQAKNKGRYCSGCQDNKYRKGDRL